MPNKITAADFAGWVQERGAYFASRWDDRYAAPLAMSDPGETQPNSSLLIAKDGNGYYVYTSLAFFRQLPAGVPGAYRDELTSLPGLRTWRRVYLFVFGCFILWVVLLLALTVHYS